MMNSDIDMNRLVCHQDTIIKSQNDEFKEALRKEFSKTKIDKNLNTNPQIHTNEKRYELVLRILRDDVLMQKIQAISSKIYKESSNA